jgi:excisionase family DNA binding protein
VIADFRPDLLRILLEPQRIAELAAHDIPAFLGDLERVRAALWGRMLHGGKTDTTASAVDSVDEVLTVPEVARELKFTRAYIYEAVRRGDVAAIRQGKYVRIRRQDLRAWLAGRPAKALDRQPVARDSAGHAAMRVGPRLRARAAGDVSGRIHASGRALRDHISAPDS